MTIAGDFERLSQDCLVTAHALEVKGGVWSHDDKCYLFPDKSRGAFTGRTRHTGPLFMAEEAENNG